MVFSFLFRHEHFVGQNGMGGSRSETPPGPPGRGSSADAASASSLSSPHQSATVGPLPATVTALSHRELHESGGSDSETEVPSSWRQRDRESRRVFRGVCGECGHNVFTDQVRWRAPAGPLQRPRGTRASRTRVDPV